MRSRQCEAWHRRLLPVRPDQHAVLVLAIASRLPRTMWSESGGSASERSKSGEENRNATAEKKKEEEE